MRKGEMRDASEERGGQSHLKSKTRIRKENKSGVQEA